MIKVGDIIKSLDFPHTAECYMIGRVTGLNLDGIECETIKQVSLGEEVEISEFNKIFRTGQLGTHWMEDKFVQPRITVLG